MTIEAVQKLVNELLVALTDLLTEAKNRQREEENLLLKIKEGQHDLDFRMAKVQKTEETLVEEKKYLIAIREEQKKKDIEQLTFSEKRREIDEEAHKLDAKISQVSGLLLKQELREKGIQKRMDELDKRREEIKEIDDRKIALAMLADDLKKREEADAERKRMLDFREQQLATREARIQKYANLK